MKPVVEIDGANFDSFQGLTAEFSWKVTPGHRWNGNLDAFNDILRGGFGTPEEPFILRWKNSERSRQMLGHAETARWLERKLGDCHPSNVPQFQHRLEEARAGRGETLFDTLVEIIRDHGPGGAQAEDGIELELA